MKKMIIKIGKEGKVSINVEGASGPECLEFTKAVEQVVGVVEKRTLTEDFQQEKLSVRVDETATETPKL